MVVVNRLDLGFLVERQRRNTCRDQNLPQTVDPVVKKLSGRLGA